MRRRRRRRTRAAAEGTDAFDLFLDALCNGLGVVMFILMIVAVYARPPAGGGDAAQLKKLQATLDTLQTELEATVAALRTIPPSGSPDLIERYERALRQLDKARQRRDEALERIEITRDIIRERQAERDDVEQRLALESKKQEELRAKEKQVKESTAFVRTSRWNKQDTRPALLLLVSGGFVSSPTVSADSTAIQPTAGVGHEVADAASAAAALAALTKGLSPASHRVEIAVWPDSYGAYKHLEKALHERGFAIQPIPVAEGEPLKAGDGGSQ